MHALRVALALVLCVCVWHLSLINNCLLEKNVSYLHNKNDTAQRSSPERASHFSRKNLLRNQKPVQQILIYVELGEPALLLQKFQDSWDMVKR